MLAAGGFRIAAALSERDARGRGLLAVRGVISILIALLIWPDFPSAATWALGLLVGINLIFWGIHLITLALVGRKLAQTERRTSARKCRGVWTPCDASRTVPGTVS